MNRPLVLITGGFVLGEVLTFVSESAGIVILFMTVAAFLYFAVNASGKKIRLLLILVCLTVMGGYIRSTAETVWFEQSDQGWWNSYYSKQEKIKISGQVKRIKQSESGLNLVLKNVKADWKGNLYSMLPVSVQLPLSESSDMVKPGMTIDVWGKPEEISVARNPGNFNYRTYYRAKKIKYHMYAETQRIVDSSYSPGFSMIADLQKLCKSQLKKICSNEDYGIFLAILLGDKGELEEETRKLYQENGIAHLLAVSGMHVSIIGMSVYAGLRKCGLGYGVSGVISSLFLLIYGILTGAAVSVVRALLMLLCHFLADYLGRTYDMISAFSLSVFFIVLDSPYYLLDGGFQLACGALIAVGLYVPFLHSQINPQYGWEKSLLLSSGIQLVTLPVLLYHFFEFPLYAFLLNLLVIPLMSFVVYSGFLGLFSSFFLTEAGVAALGMGHYILRLYDVLCKMMELLPGAVILTGRPGWRQIMIYEMCFLLFTGILWLRKKYEHGCHHVIYTLGIVFFLFPSLIIFHRFPDHQLFVAFLDVGQGDSIYLEYQNVRMLVDCGSSSISNPGKERLEPFLKSRGVNKLDYVWVTHADMDHKNGIEYLMQECQDIKIDHLVLSACARDEEDYQKLENMIVQKKGVCSYTQTGDKIRYKDLSVECLYPTEQKTASRNDQSIVLLVQFDQFGLLLTGDIESGGELYLENSWKKQHKIQVLKAAHHGSDSSSSSTFLDKVDPVWAVLSYGEGNRYGHPGEGTVKRLEKKGISMYETGKNGAIMLKTDGKTIRWETMLKKKQSVGEILKLFKVLL